MLETLGFVVVVIAVVVFAFLMLGTFVVAIYSMFKGFGWVLGTIRRAFAKPQVKQ
jgi:hypothetical protein